MACYAEVGKTPLTRYFPKTERVGDFAWHEHLTGLLMLVLDSYPLGVVSSVEFLIRADFRKKKFLVQENQPVVRIKFEDGIEITAKSPVHGEVVAFNHRLKQEVSLISQDPHGTGHLLFILPRRNNLKRKEVSTPPDTVAE